MVKEFQAGSAVWVSALFTSVEAEDSVGNEEVAMVECQAVSIVELSRMRTSAAVGLSKLCCTISGRQSTF
jgi:hypothetical protein